MKSKLSPTPAGVAGILHHSFWGLVWFITIPVAVLVLALAIILSLLELFLVHVLIGLGCIFMTLYDRLRGL